MPYFGLFSKKIPTPALHYRALLLEFKDSINEYYVIIIRDEPSR